jgi:hypothetical protein
MAIGLSTTVRNARLTAIITALDSGVTGGFLKFYDGVRPATGGTATTLLATLTLSKPSGTVSGGVLTGAVITGANAVAGTNTPSTWARLTDLAGTFVADLSVGTTGTDIILAGSANMTTGQPVSVTSWSITEGAA